MFEKVLEGRRSHFLLSQMGEKFTFSIHNSNIQTGVDATYAKTPQVQTMRGIPRMSAGALRVPQQELEDHVPLQSGEGDGDDGGSDEENVYGEPGNEEKKFRFVARSAFLTYPRCPILPGEYLRHSTLDKRDIKHAFGKQERHVNGERHLHVWITFIRKIDTINPRFFDLIIAPTENHGGSTFHCNIRRGERKRAGGISNHVRAYEYLCKYDGAVPTQIVGASELYPTSRNFRKEYGDRTQWLNYLAIRAMPDPEYPIQLPNDETIAKPRGADKKRHIWIYGPPNAGKTQWLEANVYRFKNYRVGGTLYPYDNYDGEQIIIYDDVIPKAQDLLSITNTSEWQRPVPGQTRYSQRFVPGGLITLVIVCSNVDIDTLFSAEIDVTRDAIHARFQEHRIVLED